MAYSSRLLKPPLRGHTVPRRLLITLHLYLSAFFAGVVILMATSGGLYLFGVDGEVEATEVGMVSGGRALLADPSAEAVSAALARAGVDDFDFDYVRASGPRVFTRPTSQTHYVLKVEGDRIVVTRNVPDLQRSMIELHKGHGPSIYKSFEKVFAAGMLFIILTGVWLGLTAPRLRQPTLIAVGSGLLVFLGLALS
jgi:hypothetical protein